MCVFSLWFFLDKTKTGTHTIFSLKKKTTGSHNLWLQLYCYGFIVVRICFVLSCVSEYVCVCVFFFTSLSQTKFRHFSEQRKHNQITSFWVLISFPLSHCALPSPITGLSISFFFCVYFFVSFHLYVHVRTFWTVFLSFLLKRLPYWFSVE